MPDDAPTAPGLGEPVPPPPPPPPAPQGGGPGRRSRLRQSLVGPLVGGLCGALVASGAFLAFDRGNSTTKTVVKTATQPEIQRSSKTIGGSLDIAGIVAKVEPAVVAITVNERGGGQAAGTGFVISQDGYLVTNAHVVAGANSVQAEFSDGKMRDARVVGRDTAADIALLKIDATGLPTVDLGDSSKVQVGDGVIAIGNALALEGGLTVTEGIISGPPRPGQDIGPAIENVLQTDAAINHGNSGGPLVDSDGKVIGINTAIADQAQNVGFAIPISHAKPIIDALKAGRKPAFLGVATIGLTPELKSELGVNVDTGAAVRSVTPNSPADKAAIRRGDVIVQIGGDQIRSGADVATAVRKHGPGDKVPIVIVRGGDRKEVGATLVERPDSGG